MAATSSVRYESRPIVELPLSMRGRQIWHRSAPPRILSAGSWHTDSKGWRIWRDYLAARGRRSPEKAWSIKSNLLRWSAVAAGTAAEHITFKQLKTLLRSTKRATSAEAVAGLSTSLERWGSHAQGPLDCLQIAHLMPQLAQTLEANAWWDLLDRLIQIAGDADSLSAEEMATTHQMLAGELRLTLAYLFPELKPCRRLAQPGAATISRGILDLSCELGPLHASQLGELRLLIACWTRSHLIGSRLKRGALSPAARARYARCADYALRLLTADRTQLLADEAAPAWPKSLVDICRQLSTDLSDGTASASDNSDDEPVFDGSYQTDDGEYALLRTGTKPASHLLAVDYSSPDVLLELSVAGESLWRGPWRLDLAVDGRSVEPADEWESVCWVSDKDVAYVELQADFTGGVKVQRQILLAKRDHFLYLNDVILPARAGTLEYRAALPCQQHVVFQPAIENREIKTLGSRRQALVLPLGLSEWTSAPAPGEMTVKGTQLEYTLKHQGQAMSAPLWIDLKQKKRELPFTWRSLTVAETRQILTADDAVAWRVQVGNRRFLFYRTLATRGTRTVLGAHSASEFLASRMLDDGQLETLVEIE